MTIPANSILAAFNNVESQLRVFVDLVPLVPEHDRVWSPALASCIMEACTQLDSFWKVCTNRPPDDIDIRDHFVNFGAEVENRWLLVWGDEAIEIMPFRSWNLTGARCKAQYKATEWWQAYNAIKHDRWASVRQATLANAINSVAGLFLAIARSAACLDAFVAAKWINSDVSISYVANQPTTPGQEDPKLGVTIESRLFSYASGSSAPEFERCLVCYRYCSHRFGRWLEKKYGRQLLS